MIPEQDWRSAAVILANSGITLSQMVRKAFPDNQEVTEPLKEYEERCGQLLATAAIQKGQAFKPLDPPRFDYVDVKK